MFKTPSFWYAPIGFRSLLLQPLAWIYGWIETLNRLSKKPLKLAIPVISVGNSVLGGSGKTPTTLCLYRLMSDLGFQKPVIISKGYGGSLPGPLKVDHQIHTYHDVGDEALLMAQNATVYMGKDRGQVAQLAQDEGADILILDDGHQTYGIYKDLSLLVIDGAQKIGNGLVFPAGPLREKLSSSFKRAHAVVWIGEPDPVFHCDMPIFYAELKPRKLDVKTSEIVAFSGLGFPQKFKATLESLGCILKTFKVFPDHHPYTDDDMKSLLSTAGSLSLVTTVKDYMRIPDSYKNQVQVVAVNLEVDKPSLLLEFFKKRLGGQA